MIPRITNDPYQYLILEELKQLNKTLEKLTDEHIRHFEEWREKNTYG